MINILKLIFCSIIFLICNSIYAHSSNISEYKECILSVNSRYASLSEKQKKDQSELYSAIKGAIILKIDDHGLKINKNDLNMANNDSSLKSCYKTDIDKIYVLAIKNLSEKSDIDKEELINDLSYCLASSLYFIEEFKKANSISSERISYQVGSQIGQLGTIYSYAFNKEFNSDDILNRAKLILSESTKNEKIMQNIKSSIWLCKYFGIDTVELIKGYMLSIENQK